MPFNQLQVQQAVARQQAAASDPAPQVRLVAGPGTGKSYSIEARVEHLLRAGVAATSILAVSFTRNSANDLRERILAQGVQAGLTQVADVRVGTLHSLALRVMRLANLLTMYTVDPRVLDEWETRNWIDQEFAKQANVTPGRARNVREFHEAWWSTGHQNPANYIPVNPPISAQEQAEFAAFHATQTSFYGCLLIGEIVRGCLQQSTPGLVDPRRLLDVDHLIVDEYQDLNPMDLDFVDDLIARGVTTFVAGDDDQSVYSFRHASPAGIQTFLTRHSTASDHMLQDCFRCTPAPLVAAQALLQAFSPPQRIHKQLTSLYATAAPPLTGTAEIARYASPKAEAAAIADSCIALEAAGFKYSDILILLGNARATASTIQGELDAKGVPHSPVRTEPFSDGVPGRVGFCAVRIALDEDDLVAHRNLLALLPNMGPTRCLDVTSRCVAANIGGLDLFRGHIPTGTLTAMQMAKVDEVRAIAAALQAWTPDDTLGQRAQELSSIVETVCGVANRIEWDAKLQVLPADATLRELLALLMATNSEEELTAVRSVHTRLGTQPPDAVTADRVRVMTMHGAKGLSAKVVFIPSLEESVFPTNRRAQAPGLVQEGARLLYVSLSRARVGVFCSFASSRLQNGQFVQNAPSRYLASLGIPVSQRTQGLTPTAAQQLCADAALL